MMKRIIMIQINQTIVHNLQILQIFQLILQEMKNKKSFVTI